MEEGCKGCAYNLGVECQVLRNKQKGKCFARADFKELKRREKDIEDYKKRFEVDVFKNKTVREKLDEGFSDLYFQNYNDAEIAKILKVSNTSVGNYRKNSGLPKNKKEPAVTGK